MSSSTLRTKEGDLSQWWCTLEGQIIKASEHQLINTSAHQQTQELTNTNAPQHSSSSTQMIINTRAHQHMNASERKHMSSSTKERIRA